MKITRVWRRALAATATTLFAAAVAAPAATAEEWPGEVAFISVQKKIVLYKAGTATVTTWVKCDPAWQGGEISATVAQGSAYDYGFKNAEVTCDDAWHRVKLLVSPSWSRLRPGPATVSAQFLVTHREFGDSAGGHFEGTGLLVRNR